ncbi:MAG TPA: type I-D CRISPR-associated protein Cas10d/Csc3, partial [Chloroflexi bacterium]|nr:type I-D CRISPR-associated protein Cas10d/Csc3 [Chloroflexota bacterium]
MTGGAMLTLEALERVLSEYVDRYVPAMLRRGYHLLLAKGGKDYQHLPEQSLFTHIINGVFGLARFLRFVVEQGIPIHGLDEAALRKAIALYTVHEVHKLPDVEPIGSTEFAIPLERLREEYEALGLRDFADVDEHLMRAANVHKRSTRHGDLLLTLEENAPLLELLVRLADGLASIKSLDEAESSLKGWLVRLGPWFTPGKGRFSLCWHQIKDVRGVLTNTIHRVVAEKLERDYGFYPLLYFATGTLYTGPRLEDGFDREEFIRGVVDGVLRNLTSQEQADSGMIKAGMRRQKSDFERYVYAFADVPDLLEVVKEDFTIARADPRLPEKELAGLAARRKELPSDWLDTVGERFGISLSESKAFNERWFRAYRYLLYVDTLVRDLNPAEDRLSWFLEHFPVPAKAADNLRAEQAAWSRGGFGKYVLVIAYHFLRGPAFADRPAESLPDAEVLDKLHEHVLQAFEQIDTIAGRRAALADLGFRPDLEAYLAENLLLSWAVGARPEGDVLAAYARPKRKGHSIKLCSLCNRTSPYVQPLRAGILDDEGRIFSNRVLPASEAPNENRLWCPVCHLEFVFRKLVGLGLPAGADYRKTRRLYLYLLPTFSFTPEHVMLFANALKDFHHLTSLPIQDYGKQEEAWGVPHRWLVRRELDPEWMQEVQDVLRRQAEWIAQKGWSECLTAGRFRGQPHYYLITYWNRGQESTRTEVWAKGLFAAIIISAITGCKVYVTERHYLPVADPAELKATVVLDSPPPILRGLLGDGADGITLYGRERGEPSGLERALDLASALWVVTEHLQQHLEPRNRKDKRVAENLELFNTSALAGATFYKAYWRLNNRSPDEVFTQACEVLLTLKGGELMNLVEELAEKSLAIALPMRGGGRGTPRRYELVFRETVAALRKAFEVIPELRQTALLSRPPSEHSIAELKGLA